MRVEFWFTQGVISQLMNEGVVPYMVDIGNEVTNGMLWPDGQLYTGNDWPADWQRFTDLLQAGVQGVKVAAGPNPIKIAIHIDRSGDLGGAEYFYDQLAAYDVNFDVICLSYYTFWHGPISPMLANLNALSRRYGKDIVIAETQYPFVLGESNLWEVYRPSQIDPRFPASFGGQASYLTSMESAIQSVDLGNGRGLLYFAPELVNSSEGQGYYNLALFSFTNEADPGIDAIGATLTVSPSAPVGVGGTSIRLTVKLPSPALLSPSKILISSSSPL